MSSTRQYWERREAEVAAVLTGTRTRKPSAKKIADVDCTDDISHEKSMTNLMVQPNTKQSKWMSDGPSTKTKKAKKLANLNKVDDEVQ